MPPMPPAPDELPTSSRARPDPRPPRRVAAPGPPGAGAVRARRSSGADDLPPDPRSFHVPAPGAAPTRDQVPGPRDRAAVPVAPASPPGAPPDAPGYDVPGPDAPGPGITPRPWYRRVRWKRVLAGAATFVLLLFAFCGWYVYRTYRKLERVEVGQVLSDGGGGGTNYLIVGTDTREGLDPDMENADVVIGGGVSGSRSDTVVLLRMSSSGNLMLPIPRDLYLPIAGTGEENRINTAIQGGPERLIQTVQQSLGIPVHHYVEIDFAGFLDLVGALGGVEIEFDTPAFDPKSGLDVKEAGLQELDENQALAYVRSRTYTRVMLDGSTVVDGRGDLGRIERQQAFLRAVMHQAGGARNPFTLARIGNAIASNLRVDDTIGFFDALGLARKLGGLNPETVELPTDPIRTRGGAAVLVLEQPAADDALARFR
jgi:LCP family protein required for cell wall assembly